jgi:hypothetical protein
MILRLRSVTFLIVLLLSLYNAVNAQYMNPKCKPEFDYEIMMQVYTELDVYPEITDDKFTLFDFMNKNFKVPAKDYPDKLKIKFIWMVEKDGKSTFLKLASPANDKELEAEARRVVSLLPLYSPGQCGKESVPCKVDYEFTVSSKK